MAQTSTSGRLFENSLRELVKDIVWKNGYKSNMGDKSDNVDPIEVDTYISGARYLLMFYSQATLEMVEDYTRAEYIAYLNDVKEDHKRYFDMFYLEIYCLQFSGCFYDVRGAEYAKNCHCPDEGHSRASR